MVLPYFKMMRPATCLGALLAVLFGGLLVVGWNLHHLYWYSPLYPTLLVAFLLTGAGKVINDYFDVKSDKINKPKRPIPSGQVSKRGALVFSIILFTIGIILSGFINWIVFSIAVVNSILLILYSPYLQNRILAGNLVIGFLTGSTFLFGGAAMNNMVLPIWLGLFVGLATVSHGIVKHMEDMMGDRKSILKNLASKFRRNVSTPIAEHLGITTKGVETKINKKRATALAIITLVATVIISPLPYLFNVLGFNYLITIIIADVIFILAVIQLNKINGKSNYKMIEYTIKMGILICMIAFFVGVWF